MIFVVWASLYPFQTDDTAGIDIPDPDKIIHFIFYFTACALGVMFLRERSQGKLSLPKALVLMIIATIMFGITMEVMQDTFTEFRKAELVDGIANSLGSLCGALFMKSYFSGKRRLKWKY